MYARDVALIATPIGMVCLSSSAERLDSITILGSEDGVEIEPTGGVLSTAADQLRAWFDGQRTTFDLPLSAAASLRGAALRQGMAEICYGKTISYGALAASLSSSARAIGQACARNPFPIVIPCHRVLGAGGAIGHYSAGDGTATKSWLLDHERRHARNTLL